jgi:hypothetical protein
MVPLTGSTWYCELCHVMVWVAHIPTRLRHALCRKWMVRVRLREQR